MCRLRASESFFKVNFYNFTRIDREKAAYEAKMMEKLKSRREKSGLVSREASSLNEPASASEPVDVKPKKEKKKKKSKVNKYFPNNSNAVCEYFCFK